MDNLYSFQREAYSIEGQWIQGLYVDQIYPSNKRFSNPPKILLIHGAAGCSVSYFPLMYLLSQHGYHVIAPNLPGHGKNPKIVMKDFHLWDYIPTLQSFCKFFKPDIIIGHSMGSILAQKLATEYPLQALVLLSAIPPLGVHWNIKKPFIRYLYGTLYIIPYLLGFPEPLNRAFNKHFIYTHTPKQRVMNLFQSLENDKHARKETPHVYFDVFHKDFARIPRESIKAPLFICTGELDPLMPIETEEAIAKYYSCPLYIQPRSGHLFIIEDGIEQTAQKIADFLDQTIIS